MNRVKTGQNGSTETGQIGSPPFRVTRDDPIAPGVPSRLDEAKRKERERKRRQRARYKAEHGHSRWDALPLEEKQKKAALFAAARDARRKAAMTDPVKAEAIRKKDRDKKRRQRLRKAGHPLLKLLDPMCPDATLSLERHGHTVWLCAVRHTESIRLAKFSSLSAAEAYQRALHLRDMMMHEKGRMGF